MGDRGGDLYDWIRKEWYGLIQEGVSSGLTREVYSNRPAQGEASVGASQKTNPTIPNQFSEHAPAKN